MTMEIPTGFTPGPWVVELGEFGEAWCGYWQINAEADAVACNQMCYAGYGSKARSEANANLIALAPDMAAEIARLTAALAERDARIAELEAQVNVTTMYGAGVEGAYMEGFEDGWNERDRDLYPFHLAQPFGWEDIWMFRSRAALSTPAAEEEAP